MTTLTEAGKSKGATARERVCQRVITGRNGAIQLRTEEGLGTPLNDLTIIIRMKLIVKLKFLIRLRITIKKKFIGLVMRRDQCVIQKS